MNFEVAQQTEHPVDRLFRELGHEGLGNVQRNYKGRVILLRDYFDQPDVAESARYYFDIVSSGDTSHPEYNDAHAVLTSYCDYFAQETA